MKSQRIITSCLIVASIATLALVTSCGDDGTPTGGGGLPTRELDSGNIPPGGVFVHTFNTAGTFNYHCELHSPMPGQVIVVNGAADSALVTINNNNFTPNPVSVKPTGSVRWINNGSTHTVTSN